MLWGGGGLQAVVGVGARSTGAVQLNSAEPPKPARTVCAKEAQGETAERSKSRAPPPRPSPGPPPVYIWIAAVGSPPQEPFCYAVLIKVAHRNSRSKLVGFVAGTGHKLRGGRHLRK